MGEEEATKNPRPNTKEEPICEECEKNPSKYKCPGCSLRSCSLPCVKAHKQRTGCNGKRNLTQFVPLSQFDDNLLLSDYNLLEEVKRVAESAKRARTKLCGYPQFKLPFFLKNLWSAAASRRTKLLFLANGMAKREKNQTRYNHRKKFITWTIEWRFHSTDVVLLDHGVHEDTSLCSVIQNHLKSGPWNHPLRPFCEVELNNLRFFIRKFPKGARSPFLELDIKAPVRHQLANTVILEYPVIYVYLPSDSCDFEVVRQDYPVAYRSEPSDSVDNDNGSTKGILSREEEVKEDSSSDPKVYNLSKHADSSPMHQIPNQNGPGASAKELETLEDLDFGFDQGLIDAYSDLIAEINPDDFLDLEGEFTRILEGEDGRHPQDSRKDIFSELEEGEIAD